MTVTDPNSHHTITLSKPDDWHLHVRDGHFIRSVINHTAKQFGRAMIMPNLKPPITDVAKALDYKDRIVTALDPSLDFQPYMALYLTDSTSPEVVKQVVSEPSILGFKLYPAGATTNSDQGVSDLLGKCTTVLDLMQTHGIPLLVHGEVTDSDIDVFDREKVFIDRVMIPLRRDFPELKVVFEHITTKQAAEYVRDADGKIAATITPQHLLYSRNALFNGGLQPHWYCLPVLKREEHRMALLAAATSGSSRFFLGTDSAPHAKELKESNCGCAGCYSAVHALQLYATAFDSIGKIDALEGFASQHGARFYGLSSNAETITLVKKPYVIPHSVRFGDSELVPLAAGQTLSWDIL